MRKLTTFTLLLLSVSFIASNCTKEGPEGPVGAQGPQGPAGGNGAPGTANVIYSSWETSLHSIRDSTVDGTLLSVTHRVAPSLSATVISNGVVLSYFRVGTLGPYLLPYSSFAGGAPNVIGAIYKPNVIFFTRNNLDQNVEAGHIHLSAGLEYRYVIVPGAVPGGRIAGSYTKEQLQAMPYEQVASLFNIPANGSNE